MPIITSGFTPAQIWAANSRLLTDQFTASDNLIISANSQRGNNTTSMTKVKEIKVYKNGIVRVKFDLKTDNASYIATGQIYINGVEAGTLRTTTSISYVTFSQDMAISEKDLIQIYIKISNTGAVAYTQNFRLYADLVAVNIFGEVMVD